MTEPMDADRALKASEARLQELVASLDLASIFVRDLDGTIRFWSKGCEQLYGWTEAEAVGAVSHSLLAVIFPLPLHEIEAILLREGEWSGDLVHRRRDGTTLTVAARKVLRRDSEGKPAAVMESLADVTALRQAQIELRRLNEELEARVQTEVAARQDAQARLSHAQRMEALGQLAGGIAHDFNNIIQAIQGGASLIGRNADDPAAVRRLAEMVGDAGRRGASVTRRLLAFARRDELRAEPVEVPALMEGLREVLEHALGTRIRVALQMAPEAPRLLADRSQLETVIVNLATNARDAMPDGGTLTLKAERETSPPAELAPGGYIRLSVVDCGTGMDRATLARATEPFFTTKPRGHGTGLGLSMARGFAEQSGGALAITSTTGQGTIVTLWLPEADAATIPGDEPEAGRQEAPADRVPRVLLVDDELLVREILGEQLAERGFEVARASGAGAALDVLSSGTPVDILVTDLAMPGMDGIALIRAAQAVRPKLPAILLTGYAGDAATLAARTAPRAFTLLRKPVSGAQLADQVETLLHAEV